jgi:hypothetical protein
MLPTAACGLPQLLGRARSTPASGSCDSTPTCESVTRRRSESSKGDLGGPAGPSPPIRLLPSILRASLESLPRGEIPRTATRSRRIDRLSRRGVGRCGGIYPAVPIVLLGFSPTNLRLERSLRSSRRKASRSRRSPPRGRARLGSESGCALSGTLDGGRQPGAATVRGPRLAARPRVPPLRTVAGGRIVASRIGRLRSVPGRAVRSRAQPPRGCVRTGAAGGTRPEFR